MLRSCGPSASSKSVQRLHEASDEPAEAGPHFARDQANAVGTWIGDRLMLDGFIEVGNVTGAIPAGGVVEGSAQDKGELGATMAMLGYDPSGCHLQQPESTAARHREPVVPYAEPQPAPPHRIEAAGQQTRKRGVPLQ